MINILDVILSTRSHVKCGYFNYVYVSVKPDTTHILNADPGTHTIQGIVDVPLTLTCVSRGGYPQQTVDWYKGAANEIPSGCGVTNYVLENDLYTAERACTFTPTKTDNNAMFMCQSSYSGTPALAVNASAVLILQCKILFLYRVFEFFNARLAKSFYATFDFLKVL